jgi:hypothetical protein
LFKYAIALVAVFLYAFLGMGKIINNRKITKAKSVLIKSYQHDAEVAQKKLYAANRFLDKLKSVEEFTAIQERIVTKKIKQDEKLKIYDLRCEANVSRKSKNTWEFFFINESELAINVLKISAKTYFEYFGVPTNYGLDDTHMGIVTWKENADDEIIFRNIPAHSKVFIERSVGCEIIKYDRLLDFWMRVQVGFEGESFPIKLIRVVVDKYERGEESVALRVMPSTMAISK